MFSDPGLVTTQPGRATGSAPITQSYQANFSNIQDDILIHIFLILSKDHGQKESESSEGRWDWICVTEVSRYWCTVAKNSPKLWSFLHTFNNVNRTRHFLNLSKDADLTVHYADEEDSCGRLAIYSLIMILVEMRRIRHLRIQISGYVDQPQSKDLFYLINQTASRAETISLVIPNISNTESHWGFTDDDLQLRLSHTSHSVLQAVELGSMDLTSCVSQLSGLSSLSLKHCANFSLSELLEALGACPKLSSLSVIYCDIESPLLVKSVHLPCLRDVTLVFDHFSLCFDLLESLEAPNVIQWRIYGKEMSFLDDAMRLDVFSKLSKREYRIKLFLQRAYQDPLLANVCIYNELSNTSDCLLELELSVHESIVSNTAESRGIEMFNTFLRKTECLDTTLNGSLSAEIWNNIFCASVSAKDLHVNIGGNRYLGLGALATMSSSKIVPCPKLECIYIRWEDGSSEEDYHQLLSQLEEVLKARSVLGLTLRKLHVTASFPSQDDEKFKALLQLVQEIDWTVIE